MDPTKPGGEFMKRERLITFVFCASLLLLALLGCKMLGRRSADLKTPGNRNDGGAGKSSEGLTQKTNLYIKECLNKYSNTVMGSYQRYASWLRDVEQGPTGKESIVYGLYDVSGDGQDCVNAIEKAKTMQPSIAEAENAAEGYSRALTEAVKQIKAIYPYYNHEDYKDDGFQRGKDAHAALLAAFKTFRQANDNFDAQVDKLEDEVAQNDLQQYKDDPQHKYEYEVVNTGVKAKKILHVVKQTDYAQLKADELQPLIEDFEQTLDSLKNASGKRPMAGLYVSSCDSFLKAAKELMRRVRDKKPFSGIERSWIGTSSGWMVEGSPDKLVHQYNEMIQRRGMSRI